MPGFATGSESKTHALALMKALQTSWQELDIRTTATQMLKDIGHPFGNGEKVYDVTFENVQAGLRTDYLFRLANHHGGIVIGTGDLSSSHSAGAPMASATRWRITTSMPACRRR